MHGFLVVFGTVFLAELGDKTQLATLLFLFDQRHSPAVVFLAAAMALIASTAVAVILGSSAQRYLAVLPLQAIAGVSFLAMGTWMLVEHFRH